MSITFPDRVAARAVEINVVKVVLSILALPFYVLGAVAAVVFLVVRFAYAGVQVGFGDVARRSGGG
jgi:hypothetical protein